MALIKITPFGGLVPKIGARLLPENAAQVASNIKLQSGEIRPLRTPALVNAPNKTLPALSMYRAHHGELSAWFSWPQDADVVRLPLDADAEARFAWTGDGIPKIATYSLATDSANNDYPSNQYALGIPAPITAPTVAPTGGVGATTTRVYTYTFFSAWGEESAPAPVSNLITGKVDDTWAISGMNATPPNSGNISAITYVGKDVTITSDVTHFNRVGEQVTIAGVTTVSNVNGAWTLTAADPVAKTMKFTVSGMPAGAYNNTTDSTDTWARTVNFNVSGMKRRLYRSTGLNGTVQLVHDDVGTTYNDTLTDYNIMGDELISSAWERPPVGLSGIKVHSSGALVGFVGNRVYFSEPLQAHAWPPEYQLATDRDVVGLCCFGSEVGVGTKGNPWIASGVEPASMSFQKVDGMYPCMSKRSIIGFADGLIYASSYGLIFANQYGVQVFTDKFFTKDEWQERLPATMSCATAYGKLYISHGRANGSNIVIIIDGDLLVTADIPVSALYADDNTSELFVSDADGIKAWDDADGYPLNASWRSKDFVLLQPVNLGAAKIDFDIPVDAATYAAILSAIDAAELANAAMLIAGNVGGTFNSTMFNENEVHGTDLINMPDSPLVNKVTFILRKNYDEIVISRAVYSNSAFRLPAGYKADVFSVEVLGKCAIREIRIAETMDGLRSA